MLAHSQKSTAGWKVSGLPVVVQDKYSTITVKTGFLKGVISNQNYVQNYIFVECLSYSSCAKFGFLSTLVFHKQEM